MSDTGDSGTSDTGDSHPVSDTRESSVFSEWSVVDEHGDLPDDDTTSTASSVEIVEEDGLQDSQATPVAGSPPGGVVPRFILRLPSQEPVSDTDEDQMEDNSSGSSSARCASMARGSPSGSSNAVGQVSRQDSTVSSVPEDKLDELRQTLDALKRNLQPQADNSSLSSVEMFGDGKSVKKDEKAVMDLSSSRLSSVENIGGLGNMLNGDISLESSVSSSYSFLSRDAGTECLLLRDRADVSNRESNIDDGLEQHGDNSSQPIIGHPQNRISQSGSHNEKQAEQLGTKTEESSAGNPFVSILVKYPGKYLFLAGVLSYSAILILAVLYLNGSGPVPAQEDVILTKCLQNTQDLQSKLDIYRNAYLDNKDMRKLKDEQLKSAISEKEEIASKFEEKEREIKEVQKQVDALLEERNNGITKKAECKSVKEKLVEMQYENERLSNALYESSHQCEQNIEERKARGENVLHLCVQAKEDERRQAEKEVEDVRKQCQLDLDKVKGQCQHEVENVKGQCGIDVNKVKGQCQIDVEKVKGQCQVDLQEVRGQCQMDLDKVKKQCQSDLDNLKNQAEMERKTAQEHCDKSTKPGQDQGDPQQGKESVGTQSESSKNARKKENQYKKGTRHESSSSKRSENQEKSGTDQTQFNKGDNSDKDSDKGDYSIYNWAETVMELMNKTREQIQDTWSKVKNMSETLWHEHQPSLQRLQDSFSRKVHSLSTKFEKKLARKMKRWFKKSEKHAPPGDSGQNANTKRRQYNSDDDLNNPNSSIEERLAKLSYQVEALNAKKFKKWREFPKVLNIQKEFEQVDKGLSKGNKLSDDFMTWFDCQFRWWKNLDVVTVTDDCYLSLCCWQVKVTGGDVKQCRQTKRKQGIVEDVCSLELISQPLRPGRENDDFQDSTKKGQKQNKNSGTQSRSNIREDNDGTSDQEPAESNEENWFLKKGKERTNTIEEPEDWYLRKDSNLYGDQEPAEEDENWYLKLGEERGSQRDWYLRRKKMRVPADRYPEFPDLDDSSDDDLDECDYDIHTDECVFD